MDTNILPSQNQTPTSNSAPTNASMSTPDASTPPDPTSPTVVAPAAPALGRKTIFQQWYFWVIAILAFLCIVSSAMAGYMLSKHGSMQATINDLNHTSTEKDELIAKYVALVGQKVEDSSKPGYIDTNKTTTQDFIYIGEWGIKLYIPDSLEKVSYIFRNQIVAETEELPAGEVESVCVSGIPSGVTRIPEYFRSEEFNSLGCLTRVPDNNLGVDSQKRSVYQDGTYYFFYSSNRNTFSQDAEEKEWESQATALTQELLTKNITKFQN